jgi:type I restriction enzyme S subunit
MDVLRTVRIGDLGRVVTGKTPPSSQPELFGELHPFLTPTDIDGFARFIEPGRFLSPEGRNYQHRLMLPERAVCVVCIGATIGKVCMTGRPSFTNQQINSVVVNEAEHDPFFVYHLLTTLKDELKANAGGAATPIINKTAFSDIEVKVPPLPVQRRVAGILSAYDELIENSQRRIRLLEAMARSLYREWFVHFRFPGHESVPRLPSALGDIPQGWECVALGSMIKVTHGCAFQGIHFSEEPTSRVLATPGNFRVGGGIKYDKLKFYSEEGPLEPEYTFEPMDLMVTMTDLSKAGDTLGFPAFVPKLQGLSFLHNQRVGRVLPIGEFFPKHFLYCLFCDERYRHHIVGGATGLAVKHTSPTRILGFTFATPKDAKLIYAFENFARPIFHQINSLIEAVENLRRTRDLLLPRLLSGESQALSN